MIRRDVMSVVPFNDLAAQYHSIQEDIDAAIKGVIERSAFIGGEELERFEQEFAAYCEAPACAGVANGTDAIELALKLLGVGPGDEVIVPAMTFIATVEPVLAVGAVPVVVDVDPATFTMSPVTAEAAITARTRCILTVHLHGLMADMAALRDIADRHGLLLVEDAAQAHGARQRGLHAGAIGDAATFSFFPGKNLGAYGDAGAVIARDANLVAQIRQLRNHGRTPGEKYLHGALGRNSRLDNLHAAILRVKLARLDEWNSRRRAIAARYDAALADYFAIPVVPAGSEHVYHVYSLRTPDRDALAAWLSQRGVASGRHYPIPLHRQPAIVPHLGDGPVSCPVADEFADTCLSLPIFPEMTEAQIAAVIEATLQWPQAAARRA